MSVYHPAGEYDGKTLIRHAMVALEDELGAEGARPFTAALLRVFREIRAYEDVKRSICLQLVTQRSIGPGEDE